MMRNTIVSGLFLCGMLAAFLLGTGCTKEETGCPALLTRDLSLTKGTEDGGTKVQMIAGNNFLWITSDKLFYWSSDGSSADNKKETTAGVSGETCKIKAVYSDGDIQEIVVHVGPGVGTVTEAAAGATISGAIPNSQTGNIEDYLVCAGVANLKTDKSVVLGHLQTFVSFSFIDNAFDRGEFTSLTVEDRATTKKDLTGDGTYVVGTAGLALSGTKTKKITVTPTVKTTAGGFKAETEYYVAIPPATYGSGLVFNLYNGTALIGAVKTPSITVAPGKITRLGQFDFHSTVYENSSVTPEIFPAESWIAIDGALNMTKKIWVKYEPQDMSDVEWVIDPTSTATASIKSTSRDADTDGKVMQVCEIEPTTNGVVKVYAKLPGGTTTSTVKINVGDYIYLGYGNRLWLRANLTGSAADGTGVGGETTGTLKLAPYWYSTGEYYMWGYVKNLTTIFGENTIYAKTDYIRWNASSGGLDAADRGGKYNASDSKVVLVRTDDAAYVANKKWRIPSKADTDSLESKCSISCEFAPDGVSIRRYTSNERGFKDVSVCMADAGQRNWAYPFPVNSSGNGYYWTRDLWMGGTMIEGQNVGAYICGYMLIPVKTPFMYEKYERTNGCTIRPIAKKDLSNWSSDTADN